MPVGIHTIYGIAFVLAMAAIGVGLVRLALAEDSYAHSRGEAGSAD